MNDATPTPTPVGGLYDQALLADLLGMSRGALRTARSRRPEDFLPPIGELNGGPVWQAENAQEWATRYVKRAPGRPAHT